MPYFPVRTNKFESDIKRCKKRGKNMDKLKDIISNLIQGFALPAKNRAINLLVIIQAEENVILSQIGC